MEDLGITVEFRGETTQFEGAVKKVNQELKATKSDLSLINKQLKLDPTSAEKLAEKTKKLKELQGELTDKVKAYREAMSKVDKGSDEWLKLNKEMQKAQVSLDLLNKELNEMPTKKAEEMTKAFEESGKKIQEVGKGVEDFGKKLSVISAGVVALGTAGVKFNAQMEQYQTAFTTLLGDSEKASEVIKSIQEDASKSPFNTESLVEANQYLISAGVSAEDSREAIMSLGDAIASTGGGSSELSRMAQNLQQIKNTGKATAQDIKQFANAGINIYGLLADSTGKSVEQLQKMDISYDVLTTALKKASSEGGKYYGAMAKQSETLNGSLSTLKDSFNSLLGELTQSLVPVIKQIIGFINSVMEKVRGMDQGQKDLITKIGLFLVALGPVVLMIGKIITLSGTLVKNAMLIKKVVGGLVNPFTAIISVLALLYATNEDFRNAVNETAKTVWSKLQPAFKDLWEICQVGFGVLKELWDALKDVWQLLMDAGVGEIFKATIQGMIDILLWFVDTIVKVIGKVKDLFKWFGDILGISKDVGNISITKGLVSGGGMYQSGGFMSGGFNITMNNSFNVNGNPTERMLNEWADALTNRIDENLGRMYAL